MHADALLVILLLLFGLAAFLFAVIYMFCQFFAWVGRSLLGLVSPDRPGGPVCPPRVGSRPRVCPNERCRKVEYRAASYCSQCGTPLP